MTDSSNSYGIIWDMDGVLIDTADAHYLAWQQALSPYNVHFSRQYFQDTFGINNDSLLIEIFGIDLDQRILNDISKQKEEIYRKMLKENFRVYPGVIHVLQEFQTAGFKQAIASSAPMENIDTVMQLSTLRPFFDQIVSTAKMASKRFPEAYLAASSALLLPPAHCVVIEDSILGVEGAKKAQMKCIAIASTHPEDKLLEADLILPAIADLDVSIIKAILRINESGLNNVQRV